IAARSLPVAGAATRKDSRGRPLPSGETNLRRELRIAPAQLLYIRRAACLGGTRILPENFLQHEAVCPGPGQSAGGLHHFEQDLDHAAIATATHPAYVVHDPIPVQ